MCIFFMEKCCQIHAGVCDPEMPETAGCVVISTQVERLLMQ